MSKLPTPETDAARHDLSDYGPPVLCSWGDWVPFEVAEQLERERDEARDLADRYRVAFCSAKGDLVPQVFPWEDSK